MADFSSSAGLFGLAWLAWLGVGLGSVYRVRESGFSLGCVWGVGLGLDLCWACLELFDQPSPVLGLAWACHVSGLQYHVLCIRCAVKESPCWDLLLASPVLRCAVSKAMLRCAVEKGYVETCCEARLC